MLIVFLILLLAPVALADNFWGYSQYQGYSPYSSYSSRGHSSSPRISLDLNPKHIINTSFRIAVREDRLNDVERLINKGADVDSKSDGGETALIYASRNCSPKVVRFLLNHGAKANIYDDKGRTALMIASGGSCVDVVKLLLASPKTTINPKDILGKDALDYAKEAAALEVDGPAGQIMTLLRRFQKGDSPEGHKRKILISTRQRNVHKLTAVKPFSKHSPGRSLNS